MADITREEFQKQLQGDASAPDITKPILPRAQSALPSSRQPVTALSDTGIYTHAQKLGARPGVPFDTSTGVPFLTRLRSAVQPSSPEEFKALEAAYGPGNVRQNSYGNPVVTVMDNGKPKDVLVDPLGVDFGDFASVLGQAPEIAGSIAGTLLSKGKGAFQPGAWQALKTLLLSTGGEVTGGAAKELGVRQIEGQPQNLGETATRQAAFGALGLGLGAGMGVFTKAITKGITPFGNSPQLNFDARRAGEYLSQKFGKELPMTPGELTGSTFLQRSEALALQKPGSSVPLEAILKERNQKIAEIQTIMRGGAVPDEEAAASRAMEALGVKTQPMDEAIQQASQSTRIQAEKELLEGISSSTSISQPVNKMDLGAGIRSRAFALREEALGPGSKSEKLYNEVFSNPLTQEKNIPGNVLAQDADDLIAKLPTKENTVQAIDYDSYGSPITRDIKGKEVMREFVPPDVIPKVKALSSLRGQQFRLDELMQMRREIDNDIAQGEAVKGYQTRYLTQVRNSLTKRIETGLEELDPKLLKDWQAANANYAEQAKRFQKRGIAEIFRDPDQPGVLNDIELVRRATAGPNAGSYYRDYKDFFGAGSTEVLQLRRAVADDVIDKSPLTDSIDGAGFVRRLEDLAKDAPEVLKDVFGLTPARLRESGQVLKQLQKGSLPEDELQAAIASGNLSGVNLLYMMQRQADKDLAYRNEIIRDVAKGTLKPDKIKPTQFVEKFAFKAEPSDVQQVLGMLSDRPEVIEDIRRLTFKRVLDDATISNRQGAEVLSGQKIIDALNNENATKRLRSILSTDTFNDLLSIGTYLRAGEAQQGAFASAGGIGAGQQIAKIVEQGDLRYVERALKNFLTATLYTSPAMRSYFGNTAITPQGSATLVNYAVASAPFAQALLRTYGFEGAKKAYQIKDSVDQSVQRNPAAGQLPEPVQTNAPTAPNQPSRDQFLKMLRE
jgi:hypothetical protein